MKLLHITDLHDNDAALEAAVDLAIASAPCILVVSGDLTRAFEKHEWQPRLDRLYKSSDRLAASGCTLAVCSGNHDAWASLGKVPWFGVLRPGLVADAPQPARSSHQVRVGDESAVVTCFPWRNDRGPASLPAVLAYAEAGRILHQTMSNSPWIWLHHCPPGGTPVASGASDESNVIMQAVDAYRTDVVLCGHVHSSPWIDGGAPFWTDLKSGTLFSNPGHDRNGLSLSSIDIGGHKRPPVCEWRASI